MPKHVTPLTAAKVRNLPVGSKVCDGHGLWVTVRAPDRAYWTRRGRFNGSDYELGLGPARGRIAVTLAKARQANAECIELERQGIHPLEAKRKRPESAPRVVLFQEAARACFESLRPGWRSPRHAQLWWRSIERHALPTLGKLGVDSIAIDHILTVLRPLWAEHVDTGKRLQQRLERILSYAATAGWRSEPNPARWANHLQHLLPPPSRVAQPEHFEAVAWRRLPELMRALSNVESVPARLVEWTILTTARPGMAIDGLWPEIDASAAVWVVPGSRMKTGTEHRTPLVRRALEISHRVEPLRNESNLIFPGRKGGRISHHALLDLLLRLGFRATVHGTARSAFTDWCGDNGEPFDLTEMQLAHVAGKVRRAYRRDDALELRRGLLERWAQFLYGDAS